VDIVQHQLRRRTEQGRHDHGQRQDGSPSDLAPAHEDQGQQPGEGGQPPGAALGQQQVAAGRAESDAQRRSLPQPFAHGQQAGGQRDDDLQIVGHEIGVSQRRDRQVAEAFGQGQQMHAVVLQQSQDGD